MYPPLSLFSVPVLMLVVPAVEIYVKCHDTARSHARDQRPKEQQNRRGHDYFRAYGQFVITSTVVNETSTGGHQEL